MNLVFRDNIVQNSDCYLASPSKHIICKLNSIDTSSTEFTKSLSDLSNLTFNIYRYINVDDNLVLSNGYEDVKNNMYLYITNFGWFKIVNEPELINDSTLEVKKITAKSVECELLQYDLVGLKVNTGEVDSAEYLADDNIGVDGLAKEYITFYNPEKTQLSLLHLILEKVRGWEIGHVDDSLKNKKFTFNVDSMPIYTFMKNELQQQARCIFIFDNENYIINVYSIENFGQDTSIYLSMRNVANIIDITCDDDNIYTCYNVSGGENLTNINRINFGNSYIENLSYYMCEPYMNSTLIAKYQNWLDYREEKRNDYIYNSEQYAYYYALAIDTKNRVPVSDLSNTWKGYTLEELNTYKDFYTTAIDAINKEFGNSENEIQKYPIWYTYIQYKEILNNINTAIEHFGKPIDDIDFSENWKTNPELYGLDELSYKVESYKEQLDIFKDYQSDFIDSSDNYRNWYDLTKDERKKYANQSDYEGKLTEYLNLYSIYNECKEFLDIRTDEYNEYVSIYEDYGETIKTIANDVLIENFYDTFTDEELDVLNRLRNYTDYTNKNILILETYDTSKEINAQKDLYEDAKEQLVISSQPQFNFSANINNLIVIPEFKEWASTLDVGAFIYLEVRDNYVVKLRVTEISGINPFNMQENNIKLTFSNMIKGLQGIDDYNSLLSNSINASKNSISYSSSTTSIGSVNGIELTTDILQMIANSDVFKNKFDTVYSNSVITNEAIINAAMVDNLIVKMTEIDEAHIKELTNDTAFIKYLNSTLVVTSEIKVDDLAAKMAEIDIAKIKELYGEGIFTKSLQSFVSTSIESTVDLQFIKTLITDHATISDLFTNNFVIGSDDNGSIQMSGSTMQFMDNQNNIYLQIGTDESGGHSLILKDANGSIILNGNGITQNAIADELIVNDMIKKKDTNYSGISGECLNIDSVVTQINNSETTIKSSQIYFDEDEQSLNTKLSSMISDFNQNLETNYYTKLETPDQIISILGKTDITNINGDENSIIDKINIMERDCDKINLIISDGTSSSNMTLTKDFYKLISDNITISGKNIYLDGNTTIGNGFILTSDNIKVDDLSALGATIGGVSINSDYLTGSKSGGGFTLSSEGWIQLFRHTDFADNYAGTITLVNGGSPSFTNKLSYDGITTLFAGDADDFFGSFQLGLIKDEQGKYNGALLSLSSKSGRINIDSNGISILDLISTGEWFSVKNKVLTIDTVKATLEGTAKNALKADSLDRVELNSNSSYQSLPIALSIDDGKLSYTTGFNLSNRIGTENILGRAWIILGNDIGSGIHGNKTGAIRFYSHGAGYNQIENNLNTASNYNNYLPAKSGTFALTTDISEMKETILSGLKQRIPETEIVTVQFQNSIGYVDVTLSEAYVSGTIQATPIKKNTSYAYLTEFSIYEITPNTGTVRIYGTSSVSGNYIAFNISYIAV